LAEDKVLSFSPVTSYQRINLHTRSLSHHALGNTAKDDQWNEEHLIHGAKEIHIDTESELKEAEGAAAMDAHDCSDPGMEAVAEERAVMLAQEIAQGMKDKSKHAKNAKKNNWNEEHLIHGAKEIHIDTESELKEAEEEAAMDAHDCSDPGMEAVAEERAVMLAQELAQTLKDQAKSKRKESKK